MNSFDNQCDRKSAGWEWFEIHFVLEKKHTRIRMIRSQQINNLYFEKQNWPEKRRDVKYKTSLGESR